jgi:hypothetical protein
MDVLVPSHLAVGAGFDCTKVFQLI